MEDEAIFDRLDGTARALVKGTDVSVVIIVKRGDNLRVATTVDENTTCELLLEASELAIGT